MIFFQRFPKSDFIFDFSLQFSSFPRTFSGTSKKRREPVFLFFLLVPIVPSETESSSSQGKVREMIAVVLVYVIIQFLQFRLDVSDKL